MTSNGVVKLVAIGALALTLSACTQRPEPQATIDPPTVEGSMVKPYLSAESISADSTDLIVGTVTSSELVKIADLEFMRYTLSVERRYGTELSDAVAVYQVGEPGWRFTIDLPPHMKVGGRYAAFIQPTGLAATKTGGDGYYIVGPGLWVDRGDDRFELESHDGGAVGKVPLRFTLDELDVVLAVDVIGASR